MLKSSLCSPLWELRRYPASGWCSNFSWYARLLIKVLSPVLLPISLPAIITMAQFTVLSM